MGPAELLHGRAAAPAAAEMAPPCSSSSTSSACRRAPLCSPPHPALLPTPPHPLRRRKPGVLEWLSEANTIVYAVSSLWWCRSWGAGRRSTLSATRRRWWRSRRRRRTSSSRRRRRGRWPSSASGTASPPSPSPSSTTTTRTCSRRDGPPPPPSPSPPPPAAHPAPPPQVRLSADGSLLAALGKGVAAASSSACGTFAAPRPTPDVTLIDSRVSLHHIKRLAFAPPEVSPAKTPPEAAAAALLDDGDEPQLVTVG